MKESYGEGVATHTDPESCGAAREGGVEALTGARAGRVFSRESNFLRGADAVGGKRKALPDASISRDAAGPRAVRDPEHVRKRHEGNREILCSPVGDGTAGRVGKSKDVRRR
jgi:hypothetical protein